MTGSESETKQRRGIVILCGGRSSRMGRPKHLLPFGESEVVLQRVVRTLTELNVPLVIVAAQDQELPGLPVQCEIVRDAESYQGPLVGLLYGIQALASRCDAVYLTGCDVPLLSVDFVERVFQHLSGVQVAIPSENDFLHPLAAAYSISVLEKVRDLVESGERRPRKLIELCPSRQIRINDLREVDPELDSLRNMNSPEDYRDLLNRAGLT